MTVGLLFAEHCFAQQVDVKAVSGLVHCLDRFAEGFGAGVDDHVPDHLPQPSLRDGDDHVRQLFSHGGAGLDLHALRQGQGFGGEFGDFGQCFCGGPGVFCADHSVDEALRERQPIRVFQHCRQEACALVSLASGLVGRLFGRGFCSGCASCRGGTRLTLLVRLAQPLADGADGFGADCGQFGVGDEICFCVRHDRSSSLRCFGRRMVVASWLWPPGVSSRDGA